VSASRRSRLQRRLGAGLAVFAAGVLLAACDEVPSNLRDAQPYTVEGPEDAAIKRVKMTDETASLLPVETRSVRRDGGRKVIPHAALIYNPDGGSFVYTRPESETYVRAPVKVTSVEGDQAFLAKGPAVGTTIVTTGSAELLATEYEILNQHP
jgi:hypothetical protein